MRKSRVVWNKGSGRPALVRRSAPGSFSGGTCEFSGDTLIYNEFPGEFKLQGGRVLYKGRCDGNFQDFCPTDDVAVIFNEDGVQVHS